MNSVILLKKTKLSGKPIFATRFFRVFNYSRYVRLYSSRWPNHPLILINQRHTKKGRTHTIMESPAVFHGLIYEFFSNMLYLFNFLPILFFATFLYRVIQIYSSRIAKRFCKMKVSYQRRFWWNLCLRFLLFESRMNDFRNDLRL